MGLTGQRSIVLVAIDTATGQAGLALFDGAVRAELTWEAGRKHSVQLLPQLQHLLELLDLDTSVLAAVAVARGPGSYTGVRVGLSTAQGLSLALAIPAYGIGTLDVLAAGQEPSPLPIRPLLDVGRGRFATALYEHRAGRLERSGEVVGIQLDQLAELVRDPCRLCGDLNAQSRAQLRGMLGATVELASPALSVRRPAVLAQLGWELHQAGEPGDPAALEPFHLSR